MDHHLNQRVSDLEYQVNNLTNVINALRIALTAVPVQHQHQHQQPRPFYNNNNYRRVNPRDLFKKAQYESSLANMNEPAAPAPAPVPAPAQPVAVSQPTPAPEAPKTIKKRVVKPKEVTLEDVLNGSTP
jgi:hypothetical protein